MCDSSVNISLLGYKASSHVLRITSITSAKALSNSLLLRSPSCQRETYLVRVLTWTIPRLYMAQRMKRESDDHSTYWIWSRQVYSCRICRVLTSRTMSRYCTHDAWDKPRAALSCGVPQLQTATLTAPQRTAADPKSFSYSLFFIIFPPLRKA